MIVRVTEANKHLYENLFSDATKLLNTGEIIGDLRTYFKNLNAIIKAAGNDW